MLALLVFLRPLGNLSLAWGMKHSSHYLSAGLLQFVLVVGNPYVAGGIAMLILALLVRMALLSIADLTFVLPLTALGYVISTALGRFILSENVSIMQWLGTILVFLGTVLVGSSRRITT